MTYQLNFQEEERQERERLLKLVAEKQKALDDAEQQLVSGIYSLNCFEKQF